MDSVKTMDDMRIVVCIKQVPEDDLHPDVAEEIGALRPADLRYRVNELDLQAVEQALLLREAGQAAEVVLVSVGPERVEEALRWGLAMGADRALHVLVDDRRWAPQRTASVLAAVVAALSPGLILCGERSSDGGSASVGPILAEHLDLPQATAVDRLRIAADGRRAEVRRRLDGGRREMLDCPLPALLTVADGLSEPRYVSMLALRRAGRRPLRSITLAELGWREEEHAPLVQLVAHTPPRPRPKPIFAPGGDVPTYERIEMLLAGAPKKDGMWLEGEPEEVVEQIVGYLHRHGFLQETD